MSILENKNLWYIIGFINGDGHVSQNSRNTNRISIVSCDRQILDDISSEIGGKIYTVGDNRFQLEIYNKELKQYLLGLGFTHNKSNEGVDLCVPVEHEFEYLRGMMDSDGGVYHSVSSYGAHYLEVLFMGHPKDMNRVCEILSRNDIRFRHKIETREGYRDLGVIEITRNQDCRKMYSLLYTEGICLQRKKDVYEKYISEYGFKHKEDNRLYVRTVSDAVTYNSLKEASSSLGVSIGMLSVWARGLRVVPQKYGILEIQYV